MTGPSLVAAFAPPRGAAASRHLFGVARRIAAVALIAMPAVLSGCGGPYHSGWVIHSSVQVAGPLPATGYRLVFPYIAGDLYGSPNTGSFVAPVSQSPDGFTLDLNRTQQALDSELGPADFSLRFLKIVPADARFARLTPVALQRNGIDPIGSVEWRDARSGRPLMLVYIDRPAQIQGSFTRGDETIRYDIRSGSSGYVWVAPIQAGEHDTIYAAVQPPQQLILTITPRDGGVR